MLSREASEIAGQVLKHIQQATESQRSHILTLAANNMFDSEFYNKYMNGEDNRLMLLNQLKGLEALTFQQKKLEDEERRLI